MHVHPFCKEVVWDDIDKIADAMYSLTKSVSIDDYIASMDKYNIDKAVIVSFNVKTAYDVILVSNDDVANLVKLHPNRLIGFAGIDPL